MAVAVAVAVAVVVEMEGEGLTLRALILHIARVHLLGVIGQPLRFVLREGTTHAM